QPETAGPRAPAGVRSSYADGSCRRQAEAHARRRVLHARCADLAAAVAPGALRDFAAEVGFAAHEVRRAAVFPSGVHRSADAFGKGDAEVAAASRRRGAAGTWPARPP